MRLPRITLKEMGARSRHQLTLLPTLWRGYMAVKMIRQAVGVANHLGSQTEPMRRVRNYLQMRIGKRLEMQIFWSVGLLKKLK